MSLAFYKRFARDFLEGTAGMSLELKGAYAVIIDLLHLHDGRLPDCSRYIGGQLGCSTRKATALVEQLVECGKLYRDKSVLRNTRMDADIEAREQGRKAATSERYRENTGELSPNYRADKSKKLNENKGRKRTRNRNRKTPLPPKGGTPAAGYSDDGGEGREGLPLPPPDCPLRPLAESWQAESEALWSNLGRGLSAEGGVVFPESEVVFGALERRRGDIIRCGLRLCSRLELVQRMEAAAREPAVLEAAA